MGHKRGGKLCCVAGLALAARSCHDQHTHKCVPCAHTLLIAGEDQERVLAEVEASWRYGMQQGKSTVGLGLPMARP